MGCLAARRPLLAWFALTDRALDRFVTQSGSLPPTDWFARPHVIGWACALVVGYKRLGEVGTAKRSGAVKFRVG